VAGGVPPDGEPVHHEGVGELVEVLAFVANRVRTSEPERVIERPVARLGIVPPSIESFEVEVSLGNLPDVLDAVEPPLRVLVGAVEPDHDRPAAVLVGKAVLVVPAVPALIGVAVRPNPGELE